MDDLQLALHLADLADAHSMKRFRAGDLEVHTKPDLTPVTEADQAVERALREALGEHRPHDGILGEEYGSDRLDSSRRWILDPIDGTKNYVRGVPVWATLIGLMDGTDVITGVVSAPAMGRRWWATLGSGAFTLDPGSDTPRHLRVSAVQALSDASFSYSDSRGWAERGCADGLQTLLDTTWRQRAYGDFWSHMLVAEGAIDVAAEPDLQSYDMAALIPIVVEAGGRFTSYAGGDPLVDGCALSTNGRLHDEVVSLLAR
jgi:histidinol-phosphatase